MQLKLKKTSLYSIALACGAAMLTGCLSSAPSKTEDKTTAPAQSTKGKSSTPSVKENSDDKKATKGKEVKGINGWTGTITGAPAKNSKFNRLKIGMGPKQVTDLIGRPNDESSHITGKAFIPFYHGSGGSETIYFYKGLGRLYFANNHAYTSERGLMLIEHDTTEDGYNN